MDLPNRRISTRELIAFAVQLKGKTIEASLNTGGFNATHFLEFTSNGLYDIGIDSEKVRWAVRDFVKFYSRAYWRVDQIV